MSNYLGATGPSFANTRLRNVADASGATDATTLQQVQRLIRGITSIKDAVRVASTTNVNVASPGTAIDGVTLTNGDRVLLKNQSTGSQNGIYDFNGSGSALTRSSDANTDAQVKDGLTVFVGEGTVNGNTTWQLTTNNPIVVGTTSLAFAQTGAGGASYTAGNGLSLSSNTFSIQLQSNSGLQVDGTGLGINATSAGGGIGYSAGVYSVAAGNGLTQDADGLTLASTTGGAGLTYTSGVLAVGAGSGITVNADDVALATSVAGNGLTITSGVLNVVGGTGITVAADLVSIDTSVVARKFTGTYGNGALTSIAVPHNLGTKNVTFSIRLTTTDEFVDADVIATDNNTLTISFASAPASNTIVVTVTG